MDLLVFRSRIDPLLAAFVVVPIGGVIGLVVQRVIVRGQSPSAVTVGALVLSIGLVAWIFATTSYRFTERELVVQSGPLRVRVAFDTIRRITRTRSVLLVRRDRAEDLIHSSRFARRALRRSRIIIRRIDWKRPLSREKIVMPCIMREMRRIVCAFASVVALNSCDLAPVDCSPTPPIGIAVVVRDSLNGLLLTGGASGVLQAGAKQELMRRGTRGDGGDTVLIGGYAGPYTVRVEHPGYRTWVRSELRARLTSGVCAGIETTVVTARMIN
jgi:hypothetical protein